MATNTEDIIIRAGMDQSFLSRGLQTLKGQFAELQQEGHMGFLKVGNGAKEFKKTLSELVHDTPMLGLAFKALMSPIGAALTSATMAFGYVNKKLDEWNEKMDQMAAEGARPISNTREELLRLRVEQDKAAASLKAWRVSLNEQHNVVSKGLERELELGTKILDIEKKRIDLRKQLSIAQIGMAAGAGQILPAAAAAQIAAAERAAAEKTRAAEIQTAQNALTSTSNAIAKLHSQRPVLERMAVGADTFRAGLPVQISNAEGTIKSENERLARIREDRKKLGLDAPTIGVADAMMIGINPSAAPLSVAQSGQRAMEQKRLGLEEQSALNRIKLQEKAIEGLNKRMSEASAETEKWKRKTEEVKEQEVELTQKRKLQTDALKALQSTPLPPAQNPAVQSPFTFSMEGLGQYNTQYGGVAREIQRRTGIAQYFAASGQSTRAQRVMETIYGKPAGPGLGGVKSTGGIAWHPLHGAEPAALTPEQEQLQRVRNWRPNMGLMALLPPGLTQEQQERDRMQVTIDYLLQALGAGKGATGIPVVIADVKGE